MGSKAAHSVERSTDNPHTRAVAEFIANTAPSDIPKEVLAHAKWDVLDTIGCALLGQTLPIATILRATFEPSSATGPATVWGDDWNCAPDMAALINGTLVHSFELDDLHAKAIIHPGGVTLPGVLALAETLGTVSGRDLLAAHVVGLEVSVRVGLAVGVPLLRRGWHNNGVLGVFGAAAGASNLLRLDAPRSLHAIGIAGSLASGLMAAQYGAMVKRMHAGNAAQNGLRAAMLARNGFTGIENIFEERYGGYFGTFADSHELEQVSSDFGSRWETLNVGFKFYAACGSSHTTIDALLGMRSKGLRAEQVERIQITGSTATRDHVGWPYRPDSSTTAQMNLSYAAAIALLDGRAFIEQFDDRQLRRPDVLALVDRVEVLGDPEIDAGGPSRRHEVRVEVDLKNGDRLSAHVLNAKGSAKFPLTPAEISEKFMSLASRRVGRERAEALCDVVGRLDEAPDLRELVALLKVGDSRTPRSKP